MLPLLRVASMFVDLAIVAAAGGLAAIPILLSGATGWGVVLLLILVASGVAVVAFGGQVVLGALSARSLGQRLLRLRVVGDRAPITRVRLLVRLAAFYGMPALLVLGALGAASLADRCIDDWGSTHPDWQASYDDAARGRDDANDRVLHAPIGSAEYLRAWGEEVEQGNRMGKLVTERDGTWTAWLARSGDTLSVQVLLLWAAINGAMLFTRRGPVHDRLLGTRVERG